MDEDYLAQVMAAQNTPKKRKRGGLAGILDRNKQIIKPVVSGALGLVPGIGMGLAAGAGALMSGLDREGKGGIGFDAKQGVSGALQGAAAGGAARFGKGLLGRGAQGAAPLADGMQASATQAARVADPVRGGMVSIGGGGGAAPSMGAGAAVPAGQTMGGRGLMRGLNRVGQFVDKNATATGMGLQALSGILGSQSERRLREREEAEERRRAQNLAMLVAPMYRGMSGNR